MTKYTTKNILVEGVRVVGRHRRDLGDITALTASIENIGLINPITVTEDMSLIAGERRLEAYRKLGRTTIPARIVRDLEGAVQRLMIERDENTERKPMTPEELVSLGKALEALEQPKAHERLREAGRKGSRGKITWAQQSPGYSPAETSGEGDRPAARTGRTTTVVASALGVSPATYKRARAVVDAVNDPDAEPEKRDVARRALDEMNATGRVAGAYEKFIKDRPAEPGTMPRPNVIERESHQRSVIEKAVVALSGITHGLKQIESLHPAITNAEAAQWVDGLSDARQVITVLIRRLKEHTDVQR